MELERLVQYLDELFDVAEHPDYGTALNGLQVGSDRPVRRVAAAVDASVETVEAAVAADADLLVVHHGLFWGGLQPLVGRHRRRIAPLLEHGVALYAVHLPLDAHAELGNCALLSRALGIEPGERFGAYQGAPLGWVGRFDGTRERLRDRLSEVLEGPVQLVPGGQERAGKVAVVTGGGGSFVQEAALQGVDTLVTGEGSHHTVVDARELGVNVLYGGHYATETFGVRAVARHLAERFDLDWTFLDHPTHR